MREVNGTMTALNDERLPQFIGGYFHQDWNVDFESEDDAVRAFRSDVDPQDVRALARAIEDLLQLGLADAALTQRLYEMGLAFQPAGADGSASGWLRELHARLLQQTP